MLVHANLWGLDSVSLLCCFSKRCILVHFSCHGTESGDLVLSDFGVMAQRITASGLADLLAAHNENAGRPVRLALFNTCHSDKTCEQVSKTVDVTIGYAGKIPSDVAMAFTKAFYYMLSTGTAVDAAFKTARAQVRLLWSDLADRFIMKVRPGADPAALRWFRPPPGLTATYLMVFPDTKPARRLARQLRDQLAGAGFHGRMVGDEEIGEDRLLALQNALDEVDAIVVCGVSAEVEKQARKEYDHLWSTALRLWLEDATRIFPVLLSGDQMPTLLKALKHADWAHEQEKAVDELLCAARRL